MIRRHAQPTERAAATDRNPAQRLRRDFDLEVRAVSDTGVIEGYATVFDEVTSYGEVMAPGSFARTLASWKAKSRTIPVLWQHISSQPIGATEEIAEDGKGLRIKARLITEVQQAREAHALARAGVLGGLSIGFTIPVNAADGQPAIVWDDDRRVEVVREARLIEYSLVTFPANEAATIDNVRENTQAQRELVMAVRALHDALDADRAPAADTKALLREARALMITTKPSRSVRPASDQRALTALLDEARALLREPT